MLRFGDGRTAEAFRILFGNAESTIACLYQDGIITDVSPAARTTLGVQSNSSPPAWLVALLRDLEPKTAYHRTVGVEGTDGVGRLLDLFIEPCDDHEDQPIAYLLHAQDVTEQDARDRKEWLAGRIALALGRAESVTSATNMILQHICEETKWEIGEAWIPHIDQSGERTLRQVSNWTVVDPRFQTFVAQGTGLRFASGEGIPGTAWASKAPVLASDIQESPVFTRAPLAAIAGLRGAVAIPLLAASDVVAVLVFFMRRIRPDHSMLTRLSFEVSTLLGDILQQKQAEEAHRLAEAKLSGMIAIAADAIISIDHARRMTLFNWGAERIFGYTAEEALGQPIDILLPPDLRSIHAAHIANFSLSPVTTRRMGERSGIVGMRKNGERFPAEASISRFSTADEWTYTVILRDVSERVQREEELGRVAEQMRSAVAARDQIMAVVSHDLRNPVAAMQMCLSELQDNPPPSPDMAHALLATAQQSVGLMLRLIQDLLDMTSIDAGRLALERTTQPLVPVLQRAAELQAALMKEHGLAFLVEIEAVKELSIDMDSERIIQVLSNLLENARKFTASGGTISLSASPQSQGVNIQIRDTGRGIPADELVHIFDRFWHKRRGARQRSTGLGLAIARGIAEAHGGTIQVESVVNKGSVFTVFLPYQRPAGSEPAGQSST